MQAEADAAEAEAKARAAEAVKAAGSCPKGLVCDGAAIHLFCDSGVAGLLLARPLFDLWEANFLFAGKIS